MKPKKKPAQEAKMPPGKEKAPKPQPGSAPAKPAGADDSPIRPQEHEADNEALAPDGELGSKKEPPPLF
jgi:hypothetical protein